MTGPLTGPPTGSVPRTDAGLPGGRTPVRAARPRSVPAGAGARAAVDVVVLVAATALAVLPVVPVYTEGVALPPLAGGLTLGAAVAALAARRRWPALPALAALVVVWVAAGGALAAPVTTLAGVVPTGETVRTLLGGVVTVWKEVLTLRAPLGASGGLLVAPYALAFAGAATAVSVALRVRTPGRAAWAAVVPPVVAVASVLLGVAETLLPTATGVAGAAVLLTWASWRRGMLQPGRLVALVLCGAVVVAGGAVAGPVLAGAEPRWVLRDRLTPPFDPREHPSPLAGFRRFVKDWRDTDLLTVRGLPAGTDVRLATMDAYDGVVWKVSGDGEGSGVFRRPADTTTGPTTAAGSPAAGGDVLVDVEVHALPGVWLPTVGEPRAVAVAGPAAADLSAHVRLNAATGSAVLTSGAEDGLRYTVRATLPEVPDDAAIGAAAPGAVTLPQPQAVPDVVALMAGELTREATTPLAVARSLESGLVERGWFSHGLVEAGDHPSLSGHGADRMTSLLGGELMVGDSEQYASAMALMARDRGLPARVVLGFRGPAEPGDAVTFTGDDAEAWVEIAFAGHGWVPFHPTPDESRTPDDETPQDRADPQPQVVQPPPPAPEPVTPPEEDLEQPRTDEPADEDAAAALWRRVARVAGVASVPLALLVLPALVLEALRHRRRRRRRTTGDAVSRVVGGWDEVLDAAADLAVPVPRGGTRRETAADLAARVGPTSAAPLARLASRADAAVFAPGQPTPDEVDGLWRTVDSVVEALRASVPRGRRLRARWSTASLRRRRAGRRADRRPGHGSGGRPVVPPSSPGGRTARPVPPGREQRGVPRLPPVPTQRPASGASGAHAPDAGPTRSPTPSPAPRALVPTHRDGEP